MSKTTSEIFERLGIIYTEAYGIKQKINARFSESYEGSFPTPETRRLLNDVSILMDDTLNNLKTAEAVLLKVKDE